MGVERVVVVSNPSAGRGGASGIAGGVCAAIGRSGRDAVLVKIEGEGSLAEAIQAAIDKPGTASSGTGSRSGSSKASGASPVAPVTVGPGSARAIVVCGGDGSVHAVLDMAHRTGTPIYQVPVGTENLFAREFGMTREVDGLIDALDGGREERVDLVRCNGRVFALMCSAGPDASVIHRLDAARTGPITHSSYLRHILAEVMHPNLARVRVEVDGRVVVPDGTGMVVVANSRQYAMRIDPAFEADMRDGKLDVVFLPARTGAGMVKWMAMARMRRRGIGAGAVRERGVRVVLTSEASPAFQVDGEAGKNGEGPWRLELEVVPGALGVVVGEKKSGKRRA